MRYRALNIVGQKVENVVRFLERQAPKILKRYGRVLVGLIFGLTLLGAGFVYSSPDKVDSRLGRALIKLVPYPAVFVGGAGVGFDRQSSFLNFSGQFLSQAKTLFSSRSISIHDLEAETDFLDHFQTATGSAPDRAVNRVRAKDRLIEAVIIERAAGNLGLFVPYGEARREYLSIANQRGGEKAFQEQVINRFYGVSSRDFIDRAITEKLYRAKLLTVKARHILLALDTDSSPDNVEARRVEISGLKSRAEAGESFEDLAKSFSEDALTKEKGGVLGSLTSGDVASKAVEDAALSLSAGQISEPVRSEFGWHIIKVEERNGALKEGNISDLIKKDRERAIIWLLDRRLRQG